MQTCTKGIEFSSEITLNRIQKRYLLVYFSKKFIGVFYVYDISDKDCELVNFYHLGSFSVKQVETDLLLSSVS